MIKNEVIVFQGDHMMADSVRQQPELMQKMKLHNNLYP